MNDDLVIAPATETVNLGDGELSVLIVAAKWWPSSARLASALSRRKCRVTVLCPKGHPLSYVLGLELRHYSGFASMASLRRSLIETQPDVVVPCDDGAVAQLHELHNREPSLRHLIETSIGPPDGYPIVSSRYRLLSTALELGIRVPKTDLISRQEDLEGWHESESSTSVLKVDGESGGNGVRICHSLDQSLAAWKELAAPVSISTALKRHIVDRDPLAIWTSRRKNPRQVTIQKFIAGQPANSMILCREGKVLSALTLVVIASEGPTGAATVVRLVQNDSMAQAGERLASKLNLTGFFGLDFILAPDSNNAYLIELNPRCTQVGHLTFSNRGSLADVFFATWHNQPVPISIDPPIGSQNVALFPQAQAAGGICHQLLKLSFHDVPWEEPRLVSELMKGPWPQRQRLARLYHSLRPLRISDPVVFERIDSLVGV